MSHWGHWPSVLSCDAPAANQKHQQQGQAGPMTQPAYGAEPGGCVPYGWVAPSLGPASALPCLAHAGQEPGDPCGEGRGRRSLCLVAAGARSRDPAPSWADLKSQDRGRRADRARALGLHCSRSCRPGTSARSQRLWERRTARETALLSGVSRSPRACLPAGTTPGAGAPDRAWICDSC